MTHPSNLPAAEHDEYERQLREMNDAFLVSSVRQHELTEQAQKAEAALAESEEQLSRAIEDSPIPVIMHAEDGEVLRISRSWTELTGYTIEDKSVLQTWLTKAYGYGGDDLRTAVKRLFESKQAMRAVEFEVVTRDGDRRIWSFSASSPGALRDGRRFIVGMSEDITDRKRAEHALRESQERLATELASTKRLQETSTQLIREDNIQALYIEILDAATAIMHSDMASMQIVDDRDGDALRLLAWKGFEPEFGKIFQLTGPDTKTSCSVARRIGRRVIVPDVETCDFIAGTPALEDHRKTGIRAVQSTPLCSRDGELVGMISTHWRGPHQPREQDLRLLDVLARQAADLIERSQAEEDLRKSEERFRTMANCSPMMIWMTDAKGHVSFRNRTYLEYFGVTEKTPAFDWSTIAHPDDRDAYAAAFLTALQKREIFHERARLRRFDGVWRWFESRGNPIFDEDGNMVGFIGSSADISEIYESQQALKELGQRKDEFLANMSHEIRSPLTGIIGYADILLDKLRDPEDIECLNIIKESGDYLIEIVNDILDLSKIEAGKLVLNMEAVNVHLVLAEAQGLMDLRARQKTLSLSLRYEGTLPERIQTDRVRLRQVLINLVSNAIKFTEKGRVEIVARYVDGFLQIEVIDTGIGIAPDHQEILFQPFTQADSTNTRQYGGTGLGLTITKRLVDMLGGSISFESALGKGSTFRVTIPAGTPHSLKSTDLRSEGVVPLDDLPLNNRHVLVIDDKEKIRYILSRYVKDAGGRPETVADGQAALQAVKAASETDPFDAVLLDIHMPGMNGYQVAGMLRAQGFHRAIIALTAGAMVGDREKCLQAGCDDYLTKPINRQEVVRFIAHHTQKNSRASERS